MLELNQIYNLDCILGMAEFPDKFFELAIVDPPYGINVNMNMGLRKGEKPKYEKKEWDKSIPQLEYFQELFRTSKNQIIWGGNYFQLPTSMGWIFWDKMVPKGVSFSDGELAWTSYNIALKKAVLPYCGFIGMEQNRIHPTQKPIALYKWLLKNYASPGDKILDTHGGSFSSIIACIDGGFEYIGFELDKDYYNAAIKRIENHKAQLRLALF